MSIGLVLRGVRRGLWRGASTRDRWTFAAALKDLHQHVSSQDQARAKQSDDAQRSAHCHGGIECGENGLGEVDQGRPGGVKLGLEVEHQAKGGHRRHDDQWYDIEPQLRADQDRPLHREGEGHRPTTYKQACDR